MPPARGLDTIVWFAVEPSHGTLTFAGRIASGGQIPRSFAFDRTGGLLFVGHQCSGNVVSFRVHPETGRPQATGDVIATPVPVCVQVTRTP